MRFLVDENLPADIVSTAIQQGHTAAWVRDSLPGALDTEILVRSRSAREILVTRDIRFANLVATLSAVDASLAGVVLIREQRLGSIREAWLRFLLAPRELHGIAVVTARKTRYRRLPG